jgi:hypothetical protein
MVTDPNRESARSLLDDDLLPAAGAAGDGLTFAGGL